MAQICNSVNLPLLLQRILESAIGKRTSQQPTVTQASRQTSQAAPGLMIDAKFFVVACSGQDLAPPGDGSDGVRGIAQGLDQCEVLGDSAEQKQQHSMERPRTENIHRWD